MRQQRDGRRITWQGTVAGVDIFEEEWRVDCDACEVVVVVRGIEIFGFEGS